MTSTSLFPVTPKPAPAAGHAGHAGGGQRVPGRPARPDPDRPTPPAREPRQFDGPPQRTDHARPDPGGMPAVRPGDAPEGTKLGPADADVSADAAGHGVMATGFNTPDEAELLELHGLDVVEPLLPGDVAAALAGGSGMTPAADPMSGTKMPKIVTPNADVMRPMMIDAPAAVSPMPAVASGTVQAIEATPTLIDTPLPTIPGSWPVPGDSPTTDTPPMPAWPTDEGQPAPTSGGPTTPWSGQARTVDPATQVVPAPLPAAPAAGPMSPDVTGPMQPAGATTQPMAETFTAATPAVAPSATALQEMPQDDAAVPRSVVDRAVAEVAGMADGPEAEAARTPMPAVDLEAKPATERADRPTVTADARQRFVSDNAANLVKQIKSSVVKAGGEMQIRLDPPNLGSVAVRVSVVAGTAEVSMVTPSGEAAQLLGRSLQTLKTSLEAAGINVERMQVRQAMPADQGQQQQGARDENHDERQARRQTDDRQQQGRRQQRDEQG